jgi:hypothetical protein
LKQQRSWEKRLVYRQLAGHWEFRGATCIELENLGRRHRRTGTAFTGSNESYRDDAIVIYVNEFHVPAIRLEAWPDGPDYAFHSPLQVTPFCAHLFLLF